MVSFENPSIRITRWTVTFGNRGATRGWAFWARSNRSALASRCSRESGVPILISITASTVMCTRSPCRINCWGSPRTVTYYTPWGLFAREFTDCVTSRIRDRQIRKFDAKLGDKTLLAKYRVKNDTSLFHSQNIDKIRSQKHRIKSVKARKQIYVKINFQKRHIMLNSKIWDYYCHSFVIDCLGASYACYFVTRIVFNAVVVPIK